MDETQDNTLMEVEQLVKTVHLLRDKDLSAVKVIENGVERIVVSCKTTRQHVSTLLQEMLFPPVT